MWIIKSAMETLQPSTNSVAAGAGPHGRVTSWDADAPTMVPPSSALSPWFHLPSNSHATMAAGSSQRRNSLSNQLLDRHFMSAMAKVRAVGTVEKIDSYFQKYQMGHYQANPVMPHHTPPPGSTIPILRTDAQDSGIEDYMDNMPRSKQGRKKLGKSILSEQELMVYKHALLCAQFPVLGSRGLGGSALATPTSPSTSHHGRGGLLPPSSPPSPGGISLDGGGEDEDEDSLVQEETLCVLVKEAFGLSEERHLFYDEHITRGLGNKPPAKLLVEELMGRLSLLQTNSHPYYRKQAFETWNAYDLWQQQEGQRISALINRFWRAPLPNLDPLVCKASYWASMHDMYRDLMVLLIKHDKLLKAGSTTGCPLLSSSRRLLREFSLHYGVGDVFRRIVYLDHLSSSEMFEGEEWYLKHCSQTVAGIQDLLTKHQARVTMVTTEVELLSGTLSQLRECCCAEIERLLQDRTPHSKVVCVITLLMAVLELGVTLSGSSQQDLGTIVTQSLQESVQNSYNGQKLRLTTELRLNAYSTPVSPELISKLIVHIQFEIQYCQDNYQQLFNIYQVEILEPAASRFYVCLMEDVAVLCDKTHAAQQENKERRRGIDPEMVAMARRLDRLDQDWKEFIPAMSQEWRRPLTRLCVRWFQYLINDVQTMIVISILGDKFKAVHLKFSEEDTRPSHLSGTHGHPSHSASLTQSIGSAFSSVVPRDQHQQQGEEHISNNNVPTKPEATGPQAQAHPGISFNPSGVLNFKQPTRAQTFSHIGELMGHREHWSAAEGSGLGQQSASSSRIRMETQKIPRSGAFQPVRPGASRRKSSAAERDRTAANPTPVGLPTSDRLSPHRTFHDEPQTFHNVNRTFRDDHRTSHHGDDDHSGKEHSTESAPSRSRSQSSSQRHSDLLSSISSELEDEKAIGGPSPAVAVDRRSHGDGLRAAFEHLGILPGGRPLHQMEGSPLVHQQVDVILPVSCSLIDTVHIVRHSCRLMQDIFAVLKPHQAEGQGSFDQVLPDLQELTMCPVKAITFAVRLYGSNMLSMDLCATSAKDVNNLISREVLNRVFIAQNAGLLCSCRHERSGLQDCNVYFNRDAACLCDNFEPVNPEMCLRINNIQGLMELLPDLIPALGGEPLVIGGRDESVAGGGDAPEMTSGEEMYRPLQKYLQSLMVGQVKLLAFKVNLMLSQALRVLLGLDMGANYPIADRLHPLVACIHNHLVAMTTWLYPQCYQMFCLELWKGLIKDFEKLVEGLLTQRTENQAYARLLLQAIAHLMETINNHEGHGLTADAFLEPADGVIQVLQLYTWPTTRLIKLYQGLLNKAWKGKSEDSWPLRLETLKSLQRLLCQQKKCFTGNELVDSLMKCQSEDDKSSNIWEWAYDTAEKLLGCGLVRQMTAGGHTLDLSTLNSPDVLHHQDSDNVEFSDDGYHFPKVTLHSIPRTSRNVASHASSSTIEDITSSDTLARRLKLMPGGSSDEEDVARQPHLAKSTKVAVTVEVHSETGPRSLEERARVDSLTETKPAIGSSDTPDVNAEDISEENCERSPLPVGSDDGQCEKNASNPEMEKSGDVHVHGEHSGSDNVQLEGHTSRVNENSPNVNRENQTAFHSGISQSRDTQLKESPPQNESETVTLEGTERSQASPAEEEPGDVRDEDDVQGGKDNVIDDCREPDLPVSPDRCPDNEGLVAYSRSDQDEETKGTTPQPLGTGLEAESNDVPHMEHQSPPTKLQKDHDAPPSVPGSQRKFYRIYSATDSSNSDFSDYEFIPTPRSLSPLNGARRASHSRSHSHRGKGMAVTFVTDSQQLYCFSHIYDPIMEEEEGGEMFHGKEESSRFFQRTMDTLDTGYSPSLLVAIIASRRESSARDFVNQLGDHTLVARETSAIKRLCRACFRLE